jgi:hypothetical protein
LIGRDNEMGDALINRVLGISLIIMLSLGCAVAFEYGSKVGPNDRDVGRALINFPGATGLAPTIDFLDIGANPGTDERDVIYLDFAGNRRVDVNDLRLTDFDRNHVAGTKVRPGDPDLSANLDTFANPAGQIYYADFGGSPGYDWRDPVYIKTTPLPQIAGTRDVRLTNILYRAGTKILDADRDTNMPLILMLGATAGVLDLVYGPVAEIRFYNANGNVNSLGAPIYDGPDSVYLDISSPGSAGNGVVSPNDVRLSIV